MPQFDSGHENVVRFYIAFEDDSYVCIGYSNKVSPEHFKHIDISLFFLNCFFPDISPFSGHVANEPNYTINVLQLPISFVCDVLELPTSFVCDLLYMQMRPLFYPGLFSWLLETGWIMDQTSLFR